MLRFAKLGRDLPWPLLASAAGLMTVGLLAISRSAELASGSGRFVGQQAAWCVVATFAAGVVLLPNYRGLRTWTLGAFGLGLLALMAVYWFPPINGAQRWIRLGPIGFQPSEFVKVVYVAALADFLAMRGSVASLPALVAPLLVSLLPMVLILREPDLGTSLVFGPVLMAMLYVAGTTRRQFATLIAGCCVLAPVLWTQMSQEQRSRVTSLFQQTETGARPSADGYQLRQSKQLIALGGVLGSYWAGEPSDDRAAYHLPESHTDFVFSVVGERYGWWGMAMVLAMYGAIVWQSIAIAQHTREPFGRLIGAGVAALFATQAIINTAMTVGLLPVTGLSLPLVSYGGSGLLAHAVALGLVANVALHPGYEVGSAPFRPVSRQARRAFARRTSISSRT
ncbi:MAG TPA: FtsW/RodA/SpoVE family cell cycle protein [Pirellulales bacterium]|nr:FtsW/RodA/SpoVE family cell cycle protein [Pirellulales bacterium]